MLSVYVYFSFKSLMFAMCYRAFPIIVLNLRYSALLIFHMSALGSQPENVHYRYFIQTDTLLINPLLFGFPAFLIFFLVFFCTVNCPNFGRSGMPLYCLLASSLFFCRLSIFLFGHKVPRPHRLLCVSFVC